MPRDEEAWPARAGLSKLKDIVTRRAQSSHCSRRNRNSCGLFSHMKNVSRMRAVCGHEMEIQGPKELEKRSDHERDLLSVGSDLYLLRHGFLRPFSRLTGRGGNGGTGSQDEHVARHPLPRLITPSCRPGPRSLEGCPRAALLLQIRAPE